MILALTLCALAACEPPGKGPKAERGYRRAEPVIAALERYRQARGAYPDSLPMLVPALLPDSALRIPQREQERYPFEYHRTPEGYELGFRYVGPGMNECTYASRDKRWNCHGYF
jgi:hypothetical protein